MECDIDYKDFLSLTFMHLLRLPNLTTLLTLTFS